MTSLLARMVRAVAMLSVVTGILALTVTGRGHTDSPQVVQGDPASPAETLYLPLSLKKALYIGGAAGERKWMSSEVDALAIKRDRLYVGSGPSIVTYDISEVGRARRLGRSASLGGSVTHMAVGDDRLFATTRTDVEAPSAWTSLREDDTDPPVSSLAVMDIAARDVPIPTEIVSLGTGPARQYAWDLAAYAGTAYVAVVTEIQGHLACSNDNRCGILVADAFQSPARLTMRPDLSPAVFRVEEHRGVLLALGYMRAVERGRGPDFASGLLSMDISDPTNPRVVGDPINLALQDGRDLRNLSAARGRVYRVLDEGRLLTAEVAGDGRLELLLPPVDPDQVLESLPRLATLDSTNHAWRTAAEEDRIHVLDRRDPVRLTSYNVAEPLRPVALGELRLAGVRLYDREFEFSSRDLVATDDGRLFVAGGDSGLLVEVGVGESGAPVELARYEVAGANLP